MKLLFRRFTSLFALAIAFTVRAGVMNPMPIEEMATNAEVVVHGTVVSKTVQRDPEGRIYTRVKLQIAEVWKGKVEPAEFCIVHGGGRIGDEESRASIQVNYDIGEEVVALLRLNHRKEGVTLGLVQGKFHVETDPQSGQKFVSNPFHGRDTADDNGKGLSQERPRLLSLAELKQRVQAGGAR